MNFELHWIDVNENLRAKTQPVDMYKRPYVGGRDNPERLGPSDIGREGTFWVPQNRISGDTDIAWSVTSAGDMVRIPINAYGVPFRAYASLVATGMELGMHAMQSLLREEPGITVQSVRITMGSEVHELPDPGGWRCYVGMALRTE